jgi:alanine racemase
MERSISSIAKHIEATIIGTIQESCIENVSIDSRSLQNNSSTLFFAIIGPNYDAHTFIEALIALGVRNFVVSYIPPSIQGQAQFLKVSDTLVALHKFAIAYRKNFDFPIIGITGSNGKTIVKEWLNFLLSPDYNIIRSPKSYNSQIGVPLSVIGINEHHNLGIFEAGISTTNEMEKLQEIIRPTIGLLTTIGPAHDEGFINLAEKIKQKILLFSEVNLLIYRKNKTIDCFIPKELNTLTWSFGDLPANIIFRPFIHDKTTTIETSFDVKKFDVKIPFTDDASIENVCHCIAVLLHFNYASAEIQKRIGMLYPIEMRLKVKKGIHQTTLIDDSYTADFQSLKIALDFLESQKQHPKKSLILSDIFQSGLAEEELYSRLSQLIISNKIHRVIVIGKTIAKYKNKFINSLSFQDTDAFINYFENLTFKNETILIKGARSYHFEDIVSLLEEKNHETVLEINLNAISYNLNFFKSKFFISCFCSIIYIYIFKFYFI